MSSVAKYIKTTNPLPTFFFSHGGPTFMYENDSFGNKGAWKTIKKLGTKIKQQWKPDYIIVVSAHWQSSKPNLIEIATTSNDDKENELIYDFYGFPNYMYKEEFHTKNNKFIANEIKNKLIENGFNSTLTNRGIDHGVWVPFKVAFSDYTTQTKPQPPTTKDLDLPNTSIIQVSLTFNDKDFNSNFKLGEILNFFRTNEIYDTNEKRYLKGMVICSGMSVHNLRDLGVAMRQSSQVMPYVKPFNKLLKNIVETEIVTDKEDSKEEDLKLKKFNELKNLPILKQAHPTLEHFLPIIVASGIASNSKTKINELYNDEFASLGWGIYQVGDSPKL
ncbi:uncharacterized protein KGF55_004395 [Candida pseudojiufengensis]|uniref:uncharacterized protein n=1 Tax=Candida pseudojiufengensis TaxID=497109 RepID=UPI00222432EF|nr:uncharacterized protein KGF55_004395 [Candida pseudojiufengensis]KAI5960825.1 hypothetical protein KGF55_004395 [Candida pseudojiufengensis]